ncbi:hypothetical protein MMC14_000073 [Varicellaria rhodocarpa]|nr:hypothetical protein [Varicellaria rhodocarpa]
MVRDAVATNLENSPWHKIAKNQPSVTFIRHNEEGFSLLHGLQRPPVSSVDAVFESDSNLILITMPTEVWSCLPDNPAFGFVAHVQSSNLLIKPTASALPTRVARGMSDPSLRMPGRGPSGSRSGPTDLE